MDISTEGFNFKMIEDYIFAVIILIMIIIVYRLHELYIQEISKHILYQIQWLSKNSWDIYAALLQKIGLPDIIDKNINGNAIWKWKTKCVITLHDKEINPISGTIPVKLFSGYKNVEITEEAVKAMIEKIEKECSPSYIFLHGNHKVRLEANTWEDMLKKIIKTISITMGIYNKKINENETIIDTYYDVFEN